MQRVFYSMIGFVIVIAAARQVVANIANGDPTTSAVALVVAVVIAAWWAVRSGLARAVFRALVAGAAWRMIRRR